jgi:hypothetical protein
MTHKFSQIFGIHFTVMWAAQNKRDLRQVNVQLPRGTLKGHRKKWGKGSIGFKHNVKLFMRDLESTPAGIQPVWS